MKNKIWFSGLVLVIFAIPCGLFLPWWMMMLLGAVWAFVFDMTCLKASALALGLIFPIWYGLSFYFQQSSGSELLVMIGEMFMGISINALFWISATVGAVSTALGGCVGGSLRKLLK